MGLLRALFRLFVRLAGVTALLALATAASGYAFVQFGAPDDALRETVEAVVGPAAFIGAIAFLVWAVLRTAAFGAGRRRRRKVSAKKAVRLGMMGLRR